MRTTIITSLLFIKLIFAQDLVKVITEDLCDCIETISIDEKYLAMEKRLDTCFVEILEKYYTNIKSRYKEKEDFDTLLFRVHLILPYCSEHSSKIFNRLISESEYDLRYIGNKSGIDFMTKDDVYKVKIVAVTDSSFKSVVKNISSSKHKAFKGEYKKLD